MLCMPAGTLAVSPVSRVRVVCNAHEQVCTCFQVWVSTLASLYLLLTFNTSLLQLLPEEPGMFLLRQTFCQISGVLVA